MRAIISKQSSSSVQSKVPVCVYVVCCRQKYSLEGKNTVIMDSCAAGAISIKEKEKISNNKCSVNSVCIVVVMEGCGHHQ